ncbi:hypothetical protein V8D89_007186 [Ganoderma adspersum]
MKKFDHTFMTFPGRYDDFVALWNHVKNIPYKFCTVDKNDKVEVLGKPPDPDLIAPLPPTPTPTGPQYSEDQNEVIEWMKWSTMKAQCCRDQCIESSKAELKAKREREEQEKQGRVVSGGLQSSGKSSLSFKKWCVDTSTPEAGPSGKGSKNQEATKDQETTKGKEKAGGKDDDTHMGEV